MGVLGQLGLLGLLGTLREGFGGRRGILHPPVLAWGRRQGRAGHLELGGLPGEMGPDLGLSERCWVPRDRC